MAGNAAAAVHRPLALARLARRAAGGLLAAAVLVGLTRREAAAQSVWELSAYSVQVVVLIDPHSRFTDSAAQRLARDVNRRASAAIGPLWQLRVQVRRQPWSEDTFPELLQPEADDQGKQVVLGIRESRAGFDLLAREFDGLTRQWSPPLSAAAVQRTELSQAAFALLRNCVTVQAMLESADAHTAVLRIRGGALPCPDERLAHVSAETLFMPVLRMSDRTGKQVQVREVPWTYLAVQQVEGARVRCAVSSGLGRSLASWARGRTRVVLQSVVRPPVPTQLRLVSRGEPAQPLAGYDLLVQQPGSKATRLLGRSDAQGRATLPPSSGLQWLLVRGGRQVVARLPVVVGHRRELIAEIADDPSRLAVEAFITGLQQQAVDRTARRAALVARGWQQLQLGRHDAAAALVEEAQQLVGARDLLTQLQTRRRSTAQPVDPRTRRALERLFDDTQRLIVLCDQSDDVAALREELQGRGQPPVSDSDNSPLAGAPPQENPP